MKPAGEQVSFATCGRSPAPLPADLDLHRVPV